MHFYRLLWLSQDFGRHAGQNLLLLLHCMPNLFSSNSGRSVRRQKPAYRVKHHPTPRASIRAFSAAMPEAANAHRIRLYAACAVDARSWFKSVKSVPHIWEGCQHAKSLTQTLVLNTVNRATIVLPVKNCKTQGTAMCCMKSDPLR